MYVCMKHINFFSFFPFLLLFLWICLMYICIGLSTAGREKRKARAYTEMVMLSIHGMYPIVLSKMAKVIRHSFLCTSNVCFLLILPFSARVPVFFYFDLIAYLEYRILQKMISATCCAFYKLKFHSFKWKQRTEEEEEKKIFTVSYDFLRLSHVHRKYAINFN